MDTDTLLKSIVSLTSGNSNQQIDESNPISQRFRNLSEEKMKNLQSLLNIINKNPQNYNQNFGLLKNVLQTLGLNVPLFKGNQPGGGIFGGNPTGGTMAQSGFGNFGLGIQNTGSRVPTFMNKPINKPLFETEQSTSGGEFRNLFNKANLPLNPSLAPPRQNFPHSQKPETQVQNFRTGTILSQHQHPHQTSSSTSAFHPNLNPNPNTSSSQDLLMPDLFKKMQSLQQSSKSITQPSTLSEGEQKLSENPQILAKLMLDLTNQDISSPPSFFNTNPINPVLNPVLNPMNPVNLNANSVIGDISNTSSAMVNARNDGSALGAEKSQKEISDILLQLLVNNGPPTTNTTNVSLNTNISDSISSAGGACGVGSGSGNGNGKAIEEEQHEKIEDLNFEEEYNCVWSGFLTRSRQHRVGVDAYLISGDAECLTDYNLNISHRTTFIEVNKRKAAVVG